MIIDSEPLKEILKKKFIDLSLVGYSRYAEGASDTINMVLRMIAELEQEHMKRINEIEEYLGKKKS